MTLINENGTFNLAAIMIAAHERASHKHPNTPYGMALATGLRVAWNRARNAKSKYEKEQRKIARANFVPLPMSEADEMAYKVRKLAELMTDGKVTQEHERLARIQLEISA